MKVSIDIEFDLNNESDWKDKLSLAARISLKTLKNSRKEFEKIVHSLDKKQRDYALNKYDYYVEERRLNHERNGRMSNIKPVQPINEIVKRIEKSPIREYERLTTIPPQDVFNNIGGIIEIMGEKVTIRSKRYKCYARAGVRCVRCGIEGHYFAVEKQVYQPTKKWHLNLYHRKEDGSEILMTVDHTIPLSRGGLDRVTNLKPMCVKCNGAKGNKLESELLGDSKGE